MRIVVIGAGLVGVSTALYLAEYGHEVVLIDRRTGPGLETSHANGGMLTPSQSAPWNTPGIALKLLKWLGREQSPILIKPSALFSMTGWGLKFLQNSGIEKFRRNQQKNNILASYNLSILEQLREKYDLQYDAASNGTMKIYRSSNAFDEACEQLAYFTSERSSYELLDANGVITHEPALTSVKTLIKGGVYFPQDQSGDAYKFCSQLADVAGRAGVDFQYNTEIKGLTASGSRLECLTTSTGHIKADRFVLAAGSFSALLAKSVRISLPIRPIKGYSVTLDFAGASTGLSLPIIDETSHIAVTPLGDRIRIAGMAELAGYDTSIDEKRIKQLSDFFKQIYPHINSTGYTGTLNKWAGLRPYTCDGVPILGKTPIENLYLNTGHGHLGWSMAAGSARLIADLISSDEPEIDLKPYQLDRFS